MSVGEIVALSAGVAFACLVCSLVVALLAAPWVARRLRGQSRPLDQERHDDDQRR